jgi:hypothetical protein
VPVLSWSPTTWRKIEALRDRILFGAGTDEAFISENIQKLSEAFGHSPRSMQWRKPLSLTEIPRMAPTPEVLERRGRA